MLSAEDKPNRTDNSGAGKASLGLFALALILAAVCAALLDYPLAYFIAAHHSEPLRLFFWILGRFGRAELWGTVAFVLLLQPWLNRVFKRGLSAQVTWTRFYAGAHLAAALLLSTVLVWILKVSIARPRPALFVDFQIWKPEFFNFSNEMVSFPSGHAQVVWTGFFWLSQQFPRYRWCFLLFAPFACLGRVINLRHYPSDVVIGAVIAVLCVSLLKGQLPLSLKK